MFDKTEKWKMKVEKLNNEKIKNWPGAMIPTEW